MRFGRFWIELPARSCAPSGGGPCRAGVALVRFREIRSSCAPAMARAHRDDRRGTLSVFLVLLVALLGDPARLERRSPSSKRSPRGPLCFCSPPYR